MRDEIANLITASHSETEAQAYRQWEPTLAQREEIASLGTTVLRDTRPVPGACALMCAMWVTIVGARTGLAVYLAAGNLVVDGESVFGSDTGTPEIASMFDASQPDWDGHAWVVIGDLLGDLSIFRTAYSPRAHPRLHHAIVERFGPGRGLLIDDPESLAMAGLQYEPKYILTKKQVDSLFLGALEVFKL